MLLAIESSCDETSIAILNNSVVLSNIISTQYFHRKYGGVVPELASRAHLQHISELTKQSLVDAKVGMEEMEAIGVTTEPGLIGALIVGSNFAKGLALRYGLPLVPVNHIEGHIFSGFLMQDSAAKIPEFPVITLVVSGGHTAIFLVENFNTYKIIGLTKDDAAGEAFDKIAKLCGLEYPGGPIIDKLAQSGDSKRYDFPRSMLHSGDYDFSFSGLKTSVRYFIQKEFPNGIPTDVLSDIAASVQSAIVDVLVAKTVAAAKEYGVKHIVIAGGVSANSGLRKRMASESARYGIACIAPSMGYCMDNAAMIGYIAEKKFNDSPNIFNHFDYTVSANALRRRTK
ncbi:MAG: tRNA (adenosine(37)-N6)-threonylcarbamoyltransferase complex transferase subunit TsaD [Ignavibacteria bacterium]|jgi:N6-L-threonylcarbamoyladenine synthase|nr:tRNA (adenosine(37)-N6)-threonylcarbamoyltransferase complex transferase subunit TsaD [Ignavibacteria bacterium]